MPRAARMVYPHVPHHVTARGNRRASIFFDRGDERAYLSVLAEQSRKHAVEVWAYCLMPNHVHLILTPSDQAGLARAIGEAHRRYTAQVNARRGWTGHLFQDRFASVAMDEEHLVAAFRYLAMNPVRAGLAPRAQDWPWSSVHAHLSGRDGKLVKVAPMLARMSVEELCGDRADLDAKYQAAIQALRIAEARARPQVGQVRTSPSTAPAAGAERGTP